MRDLGLKLSDDDLKRTFSRWMPILPLTDTKKLCLPCLRFYQDLPRSDEWAEQIVYTIALATFSETNPQNEQAAHRYARRFLQETLGEPLLLTQAR